MNPTSAIVLSALIVGVGKWSRDEEISQRLIVGVAFSTIGFSVLSEYNEKLASQFGALMLLTATLAYGVPISRKLGLIQ